MNTRIFGVEVLDELRGILREPTALFFSILMPVGFFVLFATMFGAQDSGRSMIATMGTFGVLSVVMMNPGIGVAQDRERGWFRAKLVSPVPVGVSLAAKVVAALPYAVGVLSAMAIAAAATGALDTDPVRLLRLAAVLLLGALPFALLGMAVGFRAGTTASSAILNAVLLPAAVFSGLWMPLEIMPGFFSEVAVFLPTYHLAELAKAQLHGGAAVGHLAVLVGTAIVAAVLAAVSYRRARV